VTLQNYTHGPWKLREGIGRDGDRLVITDSSGAVLAVTDGIQAQAELANARLMAAAPELLEAAKRYIKAFYRYDVDGNNPDKAAAHMQAENDLIAAIAKAEGGAS
jgi:hypothetical protein